MVVCFLRDLRSHTRC